MSLKWHLNESPVSSEKLNQLSVLKLTEADRDSFGAKIEGMMIYNLTKHRFEYWNGNSWKPFGGGSMLNMIGYKRYGSYDSKAGYFLFFSSNNGRSSNGDTRWQGNISPAKFSSTNPTLTSSAEHVFYSNTYDLGRPISKLYITFPFVVGALYTINKPVITITLNSVKFEVLDGSSIVAANTFNINESYTKLNTTSIYSGHIISSIIDVNDVEISNFKLRLSVVSNLQPTTDIIEHRHYWYSDTKDTEPTEIDFHPLEVQALLL
ncbi:MAG: hypothetical protein KatS3mg003_0990 [Candidatus Nitrosocaldaceae archaeon]|nr:MAG: hypothetical protein KatS3mg003_0990 [Candidatus Nitrosocaldaceae archaeon]